MATGVPVQKAPEWAAAPSPQDAPNTNGLELGMSGMSLVSTLSEVNRPPALSGSSVSTSGDANAPFHADGSELQAGLTPPSPSSPLESGIAQSSTSQGNSNPAVLGMSVPSPIGKNSTSSNTNSTPHLSLTPPSPFDGNIDLSSMGQQGSPYFEPSSLPAPPYLDKPSNSWSEQDGVRASFSENALGGLFHTTGSFDRAEQHDGLRGLSALSSRDRSQSSPGPFPTLAGSGSAAYSSSPVLYRESSPVHGDGSVGSKEDFSGSSRGMSSDPRRSRTIPVGKANSRPPLSGASAFGNFQGDRAPSAGSQTGFSGDCTRHQGLGSVPRPELRYSASDFSSDKTNGHRGRSMSLGASGYSEYREPQRSTRDSYGDSYQQHMEQIHVQKFGSPQPFNPHIQQQRIPPHMNQSQQMQPHGRHVRSFSQPGPVQHEGYQMHGNEDMSRYDLGQGIGSHQRHLVEGDSASSLDSSRYGRFSHPSHLSRSVSAGANLTQGAGSGLLSRGVNVSQPSALYEGHSHGKSSFHPHNSQFSGHGAPQGRQHPAPQRMDHPDYHGRVSGYDDAAIPVMATPEEMMNHGIGGHSGDHHNSGYRQERRVSPSQSPLHMTVGGHPSHVRQFSDGTGMSASPMSMGSARGIPSGYGTSNEIHSNHGSGHHRSSSFDDDLTHPLVGEHIDDPEDQYGAPYGGDPVSFHGHQRSLSHGNGLDQMHPMSAGGHYSMDAVHRHHPSASASGPKSVYNVKFKRSQRCFLVGARIARDLKIGCYVKVEADRGEDLGIVVSKVPSDKYNTTGRSAYTSVLPTAGAGPSGSSELKRIIRLATRDEVSLLSVKREEEDELLKVCRAKIRQRGLPMNVVDAEYQFDRHKLTFFFEAEGRIDFRELVRDLFSMYKTRIWMQQLDKSSSSSGIVTPAGSVEGGSSAVMSDEVDPDGHA